MYDDTIFSSLPWKLKYAAEQFLKLIIEGQILINH